MVNLEHRIPPPVIGLLTTALMWAMAAYGPRFAIEADLKHVLMGVLVLIGIAFDVLGILAFRDSRTTISPLRPERSSSLVTGGVYRITRNPMYVGMVFFLLAWSVFLSTLLPLAGIVVFVLYITRFQIQPEERALERIFGEQYSAYCARVRRWI
ncbi:MAG: isoprenylcysteine carboxylmethyltransferase family protein [Dokdonella sp.]